VRSVPSPGNLSFTLTLYIVGINYVTQSERRVFMATIPGRQGMYYRNVFLDPLLTFSPESPALNVYDTIVKCSERRYYHFLPTLILSISQLSQLNRTSDLCIPCTKLGWTQPSIYPLPPLDRLIIKCSPLRVLTTEYADWAEMSPNQADQKCVRMWEWVKAEDSDVGRFEETHSWGTATHPRSFMRLTGTFRIRRTSHGYRFQLQPEYMERRGRRIVNVRNRLRIGVSVSREATILPITETM
jgi:hypothetical protein